MWSKIAIFIMFALFPCEKFLWSVYNFVVTVEDSHMFGKESTALGTSGCVSFAPSAKLKRIKIFRHTLSKVPPGAREYESINSSSSNCKEISLCSLKLQLNRGDKPRNMPSFSIYKKIITWKKYWYPFFLLLFLWTKTCFCCSKFKGLLFWRNNCLFHLLNKKITYQNSTFCYEFFIFYSHEWDLENNDRF